jgi:hypothetical protein
LLRGFKYDNHPELDLIEVKPSLRWKKTKKSTLTTGKKI